MTGKSAYCFECEAFWATAQSMVDEYNNSHRVGMWPRTLEEIVFCPRCLHDFN